MIPALKLFLCYAMLSPFGALFGFPWTWITGDITFLYRTSMWIAATGIRWAGIRIHAEGLENLPGGQPCIFMANHISNLDPPILVPLIPGRAAFVIKKSLMKIPFIGRAMRMGGFIPVNRNAGPEAARESLRRASEVLASGVHIISFPEGTRSRTGQMLAFKKGPFHLAQQSRAPVIPVSIHGTETMMRKGSLRIVPGDAYVQFHSPLYAADFATREDMLRAVREAIASGLPEWMRS